MLVLIINKENKNDTNKLPLSPKNILPFKDWLTQFQNRMLKYHFMSAYSNKKKLIDNEPRNTNTNNYGTKISLSRNWLNLSPLDKSKRASEQFIIELVQVYFFN